MISRREHRLCRDLRIDAHAVFLSLVSRMRITGYARRAAFTMRATMLGVVTRGARALAAVFPQRSDRIDRDEDDDSQNQKRT